MTYRRSKHTLEERENAVQQVLDHDYSLNSVAQEVGVSNQTLRSWIRKYKSDGIDGLKTATTWKKYSDELKLNAVQDYLSGGYSLNKCCTKYDISDTSVLNAWIKKYNEGELLSSSKKGLSTMNKRHKITAQERVDIAKYTLEHDKNYQEAADIFQVSYQQVYSWVQKYLDGGEDALEDRRGKSLQSKPDHLLTEEERKDQRIKELAKLVVRQEAEIGLLKKLDEIQRRWK